MTQITYRGNLSAKVFPLVSEYFGRTVIVAGQDQNFSRQLGSSEDPDKDRGIPQLYYCHNVMPTSEGFQSIGFERKLSSALAAGFTDIFNLRDGAGVEVFFSHAADGTNWVLPFGGIAWVQINTIPGTAACVTTTATINGQTFLYFSNVGCYLYVVASNTLVPVVMSGLDIAQVLGIVASAGYMIAWTSSAIAWSSTVAHTIPTDPIDFVPSLVTGAGGGSVEAAKGRITLCVTHFLGFIVYTTDNAVAAVYSGNAKFPFNLREIVASGGLADATLISTDSGSGNHYAYTTSGLQLVSISASQTVFPEVTDFLAGEYFEDFNESSLQFVATDLTAPMRKAVNVISDRYLVISYGVSSLTHALVYDTAQKRWGKVKVNHVCSFEFKLLNPEVTETPRDSLGFLKADGSIYVVDFTYTSPNSNGVMLLGKFQYVRSRTIQLDSVELENVRTGTNFQLYALTSLSGKSTSGAPIPGYLAETGINFRKYAFRTTGLNHTLLCIGNFFMVSFILKFNIHGRR
jgi:hypothetical protein